MEKLSEVKCRLKRDHAYYAQVQGTIGVILLHTLAKEYTSNELHLTELLRYYFEHFLKFASADFNSSAQSSSIIVIT